MQPTANFMKLCSVSFISIDLTCPCSRSVIFQWWWFTSMPIDLHANTISYFFWPCFTWSSIIKINQLSDWMLAYIEIATAYFNTPTFQFFYHIFFLGSMSFCLSLCCELVEVCIEANKRISGNGRQPAKSISKMPASKLIVNKIFFSFRLRIHRLFSIQICTLFLLLLLFHFIHTLLQSAIPFFVCYRARRAPMVE